MSSQAAPNSPLVTYPPDAARPGYNYRDYYPDSPDPIYVPVPGDEGFVDQMTELEIAERSESSSVAPSDISQIAAGPSTSPAFPSFNSTTNPVRFGVPLSSTSVANPQFILTGSLSSTSVATPHLSRGAMPTLSGNSSLNFASTTRATVVPPTRNLTTGEVLPNFSAFQALGAGAFAPPTTTQQIYNVMAVASQDLTVLTMNPSRKLILQIIANLRSTINTNRIEEIVPFHLRSYVKMQFAGLFNHSEQDREACAHFLSWSKEDFCSALDAAFPEVGHYSQGAQTFIEKITQLNLAFDLAKPKIERTTDDSLDKICEEHRDRTRSDELQAIKLLTKKLPTDGVVNWRGKFNHSCGFFDRVETVFTWRSAFLAMLEAARALIRETESFGVVCTFTENSALRAKAPAKSVTDQLSKREKRKRDELTGDPSGCTGCGRTNHQVEDCKFNKSQFFNKTSAPYKSSEAFIKLIAQFPSMKYIPGAIEMNAMKAEMAILYPKLAGAPSAASGKFANKHKGMNVEKYISSILTSKPNADFLMVSLSPTAPQLATSHHEVAALLDTGSLAGDFVALRVIQNLKLTKFIVSTSQRTVCSGLDNKCYDISKHIPLYVSYFSEALNKNDVFLINAIVLESSPVDLLIGKQTIRKTQIFTSVPSQLSSHPVPATSVAAISTIAESAKPSCGCQPKGDSIAPGSIPATFAHLSQDASSTATQTRGVLAALLMESEQLLGVAPLDDDEIDYDKTDLFSHWLPDSKSDNPTIPEPSVLDQIHISGSDFLQAQLKQLCLEFEDIFCNDLPSAPANIPPFKLDVDVPKWRVPKNRTPPRPQSQEKQAEIVKQLDTLVKQGIIRVSQAAHYSQVLMVPKPGGKWRMCVDFRALNDCTLDASWPIPNIAEMLRRIGAQRCKIFGVMDLTQGYHQAPLDPASCCFTAFILFNGVYEFTRLPFGPKRAPSYFQEQMATVVLAGLIYSICEIYIDDCNVFAQTDEEFVDRLRQIFTRFRKHNMFLKAQKCFFGYSEIDFVGKVLSEKGLKMSQLKIQSVLDFPIPVVSKQLKSFLGIVNYFRDFVRNASTITKPLHGLIADYHKAQKIKWTSEAVTAFNTVKAEISKCTTMHFLNDSDPICLHTDASDYGIGGYLFQIVDGTEHPVAFVSKSLSKTQLRWSVIQKEAYAIFYVILYLQSLLRDRVFILRTDHLNLLFITEASNPMIVRWYMALSEFSFKIEFIKGVDNDIADSMSRLCRNGMLDHPEEFPHTDALAASIIPKIKLTKVIYSKIAFVHNSKVGHFGLERTIKRLHDTNNKWEFMRQHVRYFIDHCPCCQKMSLLKIPIAAHAFTTSSYTPMECLNIDFIGPFPDGGYILVIVDTFTRWVELFPTVDATAASAAQALLQHFGRFGAPHQLRSDNGPHFIADLIREFLSLIGTQHCLTLVYSKQENAIVERYNKEINRHIRALTYDNNSLTDYRFSLPFVQRILNSNYSDRLKISAADMLFGKIVKLDRGIFEPLQNHPTQSDVPLSTHMSKLLSVQDNLIKASAKELLRTDLLHQTAAQTLSYTEHLPGSYVLVHYRNGAPPTRLHTHWRGPMKVVSGSDSRYLLYDLITHKEKTYHVSDLKPFVYDPAVTTPLDVARRDYMEFFVETIIDHRGNVKRKTDLEFLVSWLGYDDRDNSWEPYSYLRDTGKLHDYLTQKNMRQLIPAKFR